MLKNDPFYYNHLMNIFTEKILKLMFYKARKSKFTEFNVKLIKYKTTTTIELLLCFPYELLIFYYN